MKFLKHFKAVIALSLVLVMALLAPAQALGASNGKYVSEVYVAYGINAEQAKKTLQDKGFTPVEGNLNDGGKTYTMLGYKTTDNIRDAITDLAVMNMRGGYSVEDYKYFLKSQKEQIAAFLEEFMAVIQEYRANLKGGQTRAKIVHDLLNNYTEDDTGMKMGDLLNAETLQDKVGISKSIESANPNKLPDLVSILLQGNAQVIKSIEVLLSLATDSSDSTWLDRFAETDYDTLLDKVEVGRPDLNTEAKRMQYLNNVYGDEAAALGSATSKLRDKLMEYESMTLQLNGISAKSLKNTFGDTKKDYNAVLQTREWLSIGVIYEGLKAYEGGNFAKGELLELFLDENDPEDEEIYIPMAAALSQGQRSGLPFIGFETLMQFAFGTDEDWQETANASLTKLGDFNDISVYANIDRSIYADDGSVALTDKAQREKTVNTAGTDGNAETQSDALSVITSISWVATTLAGISAAWSINCAYNEIKSYAYGGDEIGWIQENLDDIFKLDNKTINEMAEIPMYRQNVSSIRAARLSIKLSKIFSIATVFLAVASTVLTVIDICRTTEFEQLPIPKYMVDNYADMDGGSYTLNYKAVECNREEYFREGYTLQTGSNADLLADEGKQWLVLYASKNSKAGTGRPLTPNFVVQKSNQAPNGYDGTVHLFGEKGAVNVVGNAFKMYSAVNNAWQYVTQTDYSIYVFCKCAGERKTYDESAGNMTASAIGSGNSALFGFGGLAIGVILGAVCTALVSKNKKKKSAQ